MTKEEIKIWNLAIKAYESEQPINDWNDLSLQEKQSWYEAAYQLAGPEPLKRYDALLCKVQELEEKELFDLADLARIQLDYVYYYALSEQDRLILDNRIY